MKGLFATAIMLTVAASVWAQGQIVVTGSESLEAAPFRDFGVAAELAVSSLPTSSDWLPRPQRLSSLSAINPFDIEITATTINLTSVNFEPPANLQLGQVNYGEDSSGVAMIEASRTQGLIDTFTQPILPPTPDFQISQVAVQPAPEPSTVALGGLAVGLIVLARLRKRQQVLKR